VKFFKHWARVEDEVDLAGQKWKTVRFGGSNESLADAEAIARRAIARFTDRMRRGESPDSYGYFDRALREEIIDTIGDPGTPTAVITRNGYGALVLNTSRVMFADVDAPPKVTAGGILRGLLAIFVGMPTEDPAPPQPPKQIEEVIEQDPTLGMRVYRTAAGFRCLVTSRLFEPKSEESEKLLASLSSDPLYQRLCRAQECFRARLTPKFWRCSMRRPPARFPWAGEAEEAAMRAWEADYRDRCQPYAVCELVDESGSKELNPEAAAIVRLHDEMTCSEGLPLA